MRNRFPGYNSIIVIKYSAISSLITIDLIKYSEKLSLINFYKYKTILRFSRNKLSSTIGDSLNYCLIQEHGVGVIELLIGVSINNMC